MPKTQDEVRRLIKMIIADKRRLQPEYQQQQLARKFGVSPSLFSSWLGGTRKMPSIVQDELVDLLGLEKAIADSADPQTQDEKLVLEKLCQELYLYLKKHSPSVRVKA